MADTPAVEKILFVTLSNLGDAMMALPAFDFLRRQCPQAKIVVVAGPRTRCIFENHPDVNRLIVFDKTVSLREKITFFYRLRSERCDLIVDLKNTFYRWCLPASRKNALWIRFPAWVVHDSERHLYKAVATLKGEDVTQEEFEESNCRRNPSFISLRDGRAIEGLLRENNIRPQEEFVLVVPGSRSGLKRWTQEGYAEVIRSLKKDYGLPVVVAGEEGDRPFIRAVLAESGSEALDLSGRLSFGELCALILRAKLTVCNDGGVVHIASYLDRPVVGIYGPTDHRRYGPWSRHGIAVRRDLLCAPCSGVRCRDDSRQCILTIKPYDVLLAVRLVLESDAVRIREAAYRRILVVRTDRIGDVLLSTPVIKALRDRYPASFIAMMVSPYTRDLVDGNPYLDEVIVMDKDRRHRGLFGTVALSRKLKEMRFDAAIILHPTVRVHLVCFLAGIKERIGYDRKAPYFLTQAVPHRKQEGLKHDAEYNFDLLKPLGIAPAEMRLTMPVKESSERSVEALLQEAGIGAGDVLVAMSPAASCPSHRWPVQKFAEVADRLSLRPHLKVCVIAEGKHQAVVQELLRRAQSRPLDLSGRMKLSELASFFRRCRLVISNDSGPVHISVAVGTPVISIFGRGQPGLSPTRWRPLGPRDVVLHKKTDCLVCLAHACVRDFKCLQAITADEVLEHAERILEGTA